MDLFKKLLLQFSTSPNRFFTKVVLTDFDCAGGDLATQLDTLFLEIKEFCRANSIPLHMTALTRALLNFSRDSEYPTGSTGIWPSMMFFCFRFWGLWLFPVFPIAFRNLLLEIQEVLHAWSQTRSWFKGADTHAVLKFMEYKFQGLDAHGWEAYKTCIYRATCAANRFLSVLYRGGLWLKPSEVSIAISAGMAFCTHYRECSELAFREEKTRFKLPPKFHAYVHIVHGCVEQVGKLHQDILRDDLPSILNPLAQSCQQDEDFVGNLACLSRSSVPNAVHEKSIGLYLMNLKWWKKSADVNFEPWSPPRKTQNKQLSESDVFSCDFRWFPFF